jgi:hypothetical protein
MACYRSGERDGCPFPLRAAAGGATRANHDQVKLNGIELQRREPGAHAVKLRYG